MIQSIMIKQIIVVYSVTLIDVAAIEPLWTFFEKWIIYAITGLLTGIKHGIQTDGRALTENAEPHVDFRPCWAYEKGLVSTIRWFGQVHNINKFRSFPHFLL